MPITFTPTTVTNPIGVQGAYRLTHDQANEGMIADTQNSVIRTYVNQSGNALPFGSLVQIDNTPTTNDQYAIDLATGATGNVGIITDHLSFEGVSSGNSSYVGTATGPGTNIAPDGRAGVPNRRSVPVLRQGVIWVWTTEAVALGGPVRFWDTDHSGTVAGAFVGRFCTSQSTTRTTLIASGAAWQSETSGAGLALLEINFPSVTFTADV